MNVLLQSPDAPELLLSSPPFFVLRRYSQFRQLFNDVSWLEGSGLLLCAHIQHGGPTLCCGLGMQPRQRGAAGHDAVCWCHLRIAFAAAALSSARMARVPPSIPHPCLQLSQLKEQLPEAMGERSLQPPPKHAFMGAQQELLDRRRAELEQWMWRLIARPEVGRGQGPCSWPVLQA